MAMTNEAFEALVRRLEPAARANPGLYRLRVASFAALGYLYLVATAVLLIAILVLGVIAVVRLQAAALKFLIIYVPFVFLVLRAMWVDIHPPKGIAITARSAPQLFERIERLRKALGAPRFHRVVIDDHFNAAVVQVPLLGLFGWHRNYLVIGLPLMKALTPAQLDAVVAHELGHLAGGHARFSNWLYRLRLAWGQLFGELQRTRSRGAFLFRGFFDWYVPRFEAYSFPLARENEYAADAASARLATAPAAAQALTAVSVGGSYLAERYWPAVFARASFEPQPPLAPYADLGPALAIEIAGAHGQRWLADALARTTGFDNTHPCLADRLRALGEAPAIAPPAAGE
jgi:Zn-dependent protease with chaperone function